MQENKAVIILQTGDVLIWHVDFIEKLVTMGTSFVITIVAL